MKAPARPHERALDGSILALVPLPLGSHIAVGGGYDMEPGWLPAGQQVTGAIAAWLPTLGRADTCLVRLDGPLTASGLTHGRRETRTGDHLLLSTRYEGQVWDGDEQTVQVSLCTGAFALATYDDWSEVGVWVESHATYTLLYE